MRQGVAATGVADVELPGVTEHGDVERLSVREQRNRIHLLHLRAVEIADRIRARDVGDGEVEHRPRDSAEPAEQLQHEWRHEQRGVAVDGLARQVLETLLGQLRALANGG